jgi:hypothetical protein
MNGQHDLGLTLGTKLGWKAHLKKKNWVSDIKKTVLAPGKKLSFVNA